jgi:hypothetical protein
MRQAAQSGQTPALKLHILFSLRKITGNRTGIVSIAFRHFTINAVNTDVKK